MMTAAKTRSAVSTGRMDTALLVDGNVLIRTPLAQYLRTCGFKVLEARNSDEALAILQNSADSIHVVLSDAEQGFVLSRWIKVHSAQIKIVLTGTFERAAQAAAELCESGPLANRPYDPQLLVQEIKASLAKAEE